MEEAPKQIRDTNGVLRHAKQFLSPVEIIFSCHVCNTPISTIYRSDHERSPSSDDMRTKPTVHQNLKLWLTECGHLICAHCLPSPLERKFACCNEVALSKTDERTGGALEADSNTLCPLCLEHGDDSVKSIFGIQGCYQGMYDPRIPSAWFETPPTCLYQRGYDIDALRVS